MLGTISKKYTLQSALHKNAHFAVIGYELDLFLSVMTNDIEKQNIALNRIDFVIQESLNSCVFIDVHDTKHIDLYSKTPIKVCPLPEEPHEQLIALVLLNKINAITENQLLLLEIGITSLSADGITYYITSDENNDLQNLHDVWWNDPGPLIGLTPRKIKKEKVVQMKKEPNVDWVSLGLSWKKEIKSDKGEIVFIPVDK